MDNLKHLIDKDIQTDLSTKRYDHVIRVVETAKNIAQVYNVDQEKVEVAALAHDITKEKSLSWQLEFLKKYQIIDEFILNTEPVMHSITGAYYLQEKYQVTDTQILNAIMYHTLGHPQMDEVAMVLYIADYIEPARTQPGVDKLRKLVGGEELLEIAKRIAKMEISYLTSVSKQVHPDTLALSKK